MPTSSAQTATAPQSFRFMNLDKLIATQVQTKPYEYCVVPEFIFPAQFEALVNDYPKITQRGSFPLQSVSVGKLVQELINEFNSDSFRSVIEQKFNVSLNDRPTIFTLRGMCDKRDGKIHTDTESKIITLLLYMNQRWDKNEGGRLRVLNSPNLEDYAAEIPPSLGTLLVFKRSDHSFHGHKPFAGVRRVIQMNWVTEQKYVDSSLKRHGFSAWLKKLNPFGGEY